MSSCQPPITPTMAACGCSAAGCAAGTPIKPTHPRPGGGGRWIRSGTTGATHTTVARVPFGTGRHAPHRLNTAQQLPWGGVDPGARGGLRARVQEVACSLAAVPWGGGRPRSARRRGGGRHRQTLASLPPPGGAAGVVVASEQGPREGAGCSRSTHAPWRAAGGHTDGGTVPS